MRRFASTALCVVSCFGSAMCSRAADDTAAPVTATPALVGAAQTPQAVGATLPPPNAVFKDFHDNLQHYLAVRAKVEDTIPKLNDTKDPRKIEDRSQRLGKGIQEARASAKQGEIFSPNVAVEVRRILEADAASRTAKEKANIMDEVPDVQPVINGFYPTDSPKGPTALASFPPKLLALLPELPETIEYRFLGSALVLRDAVANIIIDYLPKAAPASAGRGGVQ